jgi:hypothetical protein
VRRKFPEVVGQGVNLEPNRVGLERVAGQSRPIDGVLALLDPLLGGAALVVKGDRAFIRRKYS